MKSAAATCSSLGVALVRVWRAYGRAFEAGLNVILGLLLAGLLVLWRLVGARWVVVMVGPFTLQFGLRGRALGWQRLVGCGLAYVHFEARPGMGVVAYTEGRRRLCVRLTDRLALLPAQPIGSIDLRLSVDAREMTLALRRIEAEVAKFANTNVIGGTK